MEAMTIDELIYELGRIKKTRNLTGNEKVVLGSNYGDRCGTEQTLYEIRKALKTTGLVQVRHCMCKNTFCWLEKH